MKKGYIFLIITSILLLSLTCVGFALSQKELTSYVANIKLEATSGYPPKLTQLVNEGVLQETALMSLIPQLSIARLSTSTPHTILSGTIKVDCGGIYNETKEFNLVNYNPGDKMSQEFIFKNLPPQRVCSIIAQVTECETQELFCTKNKIYLIINTE